MTSDKQNCLPILRSNQVIVMGVHVVSARGNANEHIDVYQGEN